MPRRPAATCASGSGPRATRVRNRSRRCRFATYGSPRQRAVGFCASWTGQFDASVERWPRPCSRSRPVRRVMPRRSFSAGGGGSRLTSTCNPRRGRCLRNCRSSRASCGREPLLLGPCGERRGGGIRETTEDDVVLPEMSSLKSPRPCGVQTGGQVEMLQRSFIRQTSAALQTGPRGAFSAEIDHKVGMLWMSGPVFRKR